MRLLRPFLCAALVAVPACGGDSGTTPPPTTNPPPGQTLATVALATTSFNVMAGATESLAPQALDASGAVIAGVTGFTFSSSDEAVIEVEADGSVLAVSAGTAVVTVSLTRDGVTATAQANFTVTGDLPSMVTIVAGNNSNDFTPPFVAVAVDAEVTFSFGARLHNVTHGSAAGAPPNIPNTSNANVISTFTTAGDFTYDCTLHPGMQGTVVVR